MFDQQSFDWDSPVKTHKACTKCGIVKSLDEFYAYKAMRDGRRPECKECAKALVNARSNTPEGKARQAAYNAARWADPDIRATLVQKLAQYRSKPENAERARQRTREWYSVPENKKRSEAWKAQYLAVPERRQLASARRSDWQKANPEGVRAQRHKRRAMKRASPGSHTRAEIEALLVAQNYCCANCEADLRIVKRHLDHWMPLILGGSNCIENLQWLCETCNLKKKSKNPIDWLVRIGKASHYPKKLE